MSLNAPLMSDAASGDPFYTFKDAMISQVKELNLNFDRWTDMLQNTNTATNSSFKPFNNKLLKQLNDVQLSLDDLRGTVVMVENRRIDFPHINEIELVSRRNFIEEMSNAINRVRSTIQSQRTQKKLDKDARESVMNKKNKDQEVYDRRHAPAGGGEFYRNERTTQELMLKEQDNVIIDLGAGVKRVGELAETINYEIQDQNRLLDDLGESVSGLQRSIDLVTGKIGKFLKTNNNCQIYTVMILSLVAVGLALLVILT